MTARNTRITRSSAWYCCPSTSASTTASVSGAPIQTGMCRRMRKPSAAPRNSATWVAAHARTIVTPKSHTSGRGKRSRTLTASERPVTMPSRAKVLQKDQHEGAERDDPEQRVAELRTAGDVGRPVAGVDEAYRDDEAGAEVAQQLAREEVAEERAGAVGLRVRRRCWRRAGAWVRRRTRRAEQLVAAVTGWGPDLAVAPADVKPSGPETRPRMPMNLGGGCGRRAVQTTTSPPTITSR